LIPKIRYIISKKIKSKKSKSCSIL